jgi:Fic family protein
MATITEAELAAIERVLEDRPDGVSMGDLVGSGASETKRRQMRLRLSKLIEAGRARSEGERRWTRYFAAAATSPTPPRPPPAQEPAGEDDAEGAQDAIAIPLSSPGEGVRRLVRKPVLQRTPVGYKRQFLSSYKPNVSEYLPQSVRDRLQKIGTIDSQTQPAGTYARNILGRLLIDLSWSSSKLEGNTYSILDTETLIELGKVAEGKSAEETAMILNHKGAIEFLVDAADDIGFNRYTLLNLHSLLAENLLDAGSIGRLRTRIVAITSSVYTPLNTPQVIEECFDELLAKAEAIQNPFEQSFFACIHLPYLQPFEDVNKRVSRLAANIPFIKRNLAPISFIDVPKDLYVEAMLGVYELNRVELAVDLFQWAYERSARRYTAIQQSFGAPDAFRLRYREQLRSLVAMIVRERLSRPAATRAIDEFSTANVPIVDRAAFIEASQTELVGLHEGSFARYKIKPSEFYAWKAQWEAA